MEEIDEVRRVRAKHSSTSAEWRSPPSVLERALAVLERIDLDPASTADANRAVKAEKFYDEAADGMQKKWRGRVFLNPPGGDLLSPRYGTDVNGDPILKPSDIVDRHRSLAKKWGTRSHATAFFYKMLDQYSRGRMEAGIFLAFSIETLQVAQAAESGEDILRRSLICVPSSRLWFLTPDGKEASAPTHANAIILMSEDPEMRVRFVKEFSSLGVVLNMTDEERESCD